MGIKKPLVSILLCSYNAEKFIEITLNSLLNQSYENIEILILDNNSKDNTVKIIKKYLDKKNPVKLFQSDKNLGPYDGLNFLINKSKGEYISITDHDDIYHPDKINLQINFLENHKFFLGCGTNLYKYYEINDRFSLIKINKIDFFSAHPSLVFRNLSNLKYNTNIKYKTDTYFMRYILCKNKKTLYNIQKPLYLSRVRSDNNNLSRIWNNDLTFKQIFNYYKYTKDKNSFIKFIIKKYVFYNFFQNFYYKLKSKPIKHFKKDSFFKEYLRYLK
ncbi:MAG: glycosyltransferase family 2 protein [Nanoarchaeota archaeon]